MSTNSTTTNAEIPAYIFYHYTPSLPAAAAFAALFFLFSLHHTYNLFRTRSWFFIAFTIGGFFEALGYTFRILSHKDKTALLPYIQQNLFLLVAPALLAATIYMTLSRILVATDFEMVLRPISKRWTTKFFVLGDIISFIMQGGGGGLLATAGREGNVNQYKMGENLILGGLGVQLMFLFGYMVTVVWCAWGLKRVGRNLSRGSQDIRLTGITDSTGGSHRLPSSDDEETAGGGFATAARLQIAHQGLVVLFVTSLLIFIRSVFRVIEYIQGHDGYLMRHEVWLYIFDGTIILAVVAVFCWWYPTEMLRTVGGDVKITGKRRVDGTEKRRRRG